MKRDYLQDAIQTIRIECAELERLQEQLDNSFNTAIELILSCSGKLVVMGMGKSALVGQKCVATFNSTGTPSQFLHAAEAFHGDLGLLTSKDVIIIISNSGTSPEILSVLPFITSTAQSIIAITGNLNSPLAKEADVVLNAQVHQEACPNNLAPTSSTTKQMVIGDALAVALMNAKNFTEYDFAAYHPGGTLGKNLTWKVLQLMDTQEKPFVTKDSTIQEVILTLSSTKYGVCVVMEGDTIQGVITDGDLRRVLAKHQNLEGIIANQMMTENPKTISKDAKATQALEIMQKFDIGQLVVEEQGKYIGIIDLHQLLDNGINI